jgi:hypothetical protein
METYGSSGADVIVNYKGVGSEGQSKAISGRDLAHRMPLPAGNLRDLEEEPLASGVFKAGLDYAEFHCA